MRQKSDSVFLLTLVDLLVQVIFFAIFLGAIHLSIEGRADPEIKKISDPKAKIIVEIGVLKVAELVNEMVRLVPIDRIMELSVLLPEFKSIESLKAALRLAKAANFNPKVLEEQVKDLEKKSAAGVGLPVCLLDSDKNKNLLRLQGLDGYYVLSIITPKAQELLHKFQLDLKEGDRLTPEQLDDMGRVIANDKKECRYSVIYEPIVDSLLSYRRVQKYFYPRIPSGWSIPQ